MQGEMLVLVLAKVRLGFGVGGGWARGAGGRAGLRREGICRNPTPSSINHPTPLHSQQWRGKTKSDQYWGSKLAAAGGAYECYLTPEQAACGWWVVRGGW